MNSNPEARILLFKNSEIQKTSKNYKTKFSEFDKYKGFYHSENIYLTKRHTKKSHS